MWYHHCLGWSSPLHVSNLPQNQHFGVVAHELNKWRNVAPKLLQYQLNITVWTTLFLHEQSIPLRPTYTHFVSGRWERTKLHFSHQRVGFFRLFSSLLHAVTCCVVGSMTTAAFPCWDAWTCCFLFAFLQSSRRCFALSIILCYLLPYLIIPTLSSAPHNCNK